MDSHLKGRPKNIILYVQVFFRDRVSLCSFDSSGNQTIDQIGLKLRYPSVYDSQILGLKVYIITDRPKYF